MKEVSINVTFALTLTTATKIDHSSSAVCTILFANNVLTTSDTNLTAPSAEKKSPSIVSSSTIIFMNYCLNRKFSPIADSRPLKLIIQDRLTLKKDQ